MLQGSIDGKANALKNKIQLQKWNEKMTQLQQWLSYEIETSTISREEKETLKAIMNGIVKLTQPRKGV